MILFVHQQRLDVEIFRPKRVRQIVAQRMWFTTGQMNAQIQSAVQFVHKLAAVAARRVVNGDRRETFFSAQPGVADGALFGMNRLLHGRAEEFHVGAEIPRSAHAARNCANVEVRQRRTGAGRRQRQQRECQRVFVQSRCAFKH